MTNLSDPYDVLAGLPETFAHAASEAEREARDAKVRADTLRKAQREAEIARDGAEKWREEPPAAAPFVIDDAARQRAYEAFTGPLRSRFLDEIGRNNLQLQINAALDAAFGPIATTVEADR